MASVLAIAAVIPPQEHPLQHDLALFSSPTSKQKISPQRSPHFSNNSEPLQHQLADSDCGSPTKHCGLSPRRVQSLPRAWERRPATPCVARNDAQKIWKRVPLGAVAANDEQKWRKEPSKLNTRPVKRLRVTQTGEDEDKENGEYVGSKWEEDGVATPSPKRKALECGDLQKREMEQDQNTPNPVEVDEDADDADLLDKTGHGTASSELGSRHLPELVAAGSPVEVKEASPVGAIDTILPSIEAEEPDVASTAVTHSSPASRTIGSMAFPPKSPKKASPAKSGASNEDNQDDVATAHKIQALPAEVSLEDENATYLWGFLSRSKARKDVQEHFEQGEPVHDEAAIEAEHQAAEEPMSTRTGNSSATTPEPEDAAMSLAPASWLTSLQADLLLSPRRSSRLTTRLPVPQKPLSKPATTIALKRLNGSEFVANHRETQSIAVATRTNTRSNKFGALAVKTRLIQLTAEIKAREASFTSQEGREVSNDETINTKVNKRKEVVWAEILARYQDGSESLKDSDVRQEETPARDIVAELMQEELLSSSPEWTPEPEANPDTETKPETLADQSIHGLLQMLKDKDKDKNKSGIRKVRKMRKLKGGSVNGTPAPKKFTSTQLPVPVGSKIPTFGASSVGANKTRSADSVKAEETAPEAAKTEDRVQTRTRSRNPKGV